MTKYNIVITHNDSIAKNIEILAASQTDPTWTIYKIMYPQKSLSLSPSPQPLAYAIYLG